MKLPRWLVPRGAAVAATLLAFASLGGCGTKDSLVVVTVSAEDAYYATGLRSLVVSCGGTTQVFHISAGISTSPITVGMYVPSSTTGRQTVTAEAVGTACGPGYSGSTTVPISAAGATVTATITMLQANTCPPTSGGTGGRSGTGGMNGTGGTPACVSSAAPAPGTPPQLNCCTEYDQVTPENCDPSTGTSIDAVAFSPDGQTLVTAGTDGFDVKVWSFNGHTLSYTGNVLDSDGFRSLAFSADGTILAVPVQGGVDLWNTSDWSFNTTLLGSSNFFVGAQFTPDQTHIIALDLNSTVSPETGNLYVFDLRGATPQVPVAVVPLPDHPDGLAVAPKAVGGQLGVAVTYLDGYADVFSYANAAFSASKNLLVDSTGDAIWTPAFSPDGTLLAIGDTNSLIHFWSFPLPTSLAESGSEIAFGTSSYADVVFALAFSPNGSYLAAGGGDYGGDALDSTLSLFNVASRAQLATVTSSHDVTAVAFSPSGNAIAGGEYNCGIFFVCTN